MFDLMQYALIFYDFQLILAQMTHEGLDLARVCPLGLSSAPPRCLSA